MAVVHRVCSVLGSDPPFEGKTTHEQNTLIEHDAQDASQSDPMAVKSEIRPSRSSTQNGKNGDIRCVASRIALPCFDDISNTCIRRRRKLVKPRIIATTCLNFLNFKFCKDL